MTWAGATPTTGTLMAMVTSSQLAALAGRLLRGRAFRVSALRVGGLKDLLSGAAWLCGLFSHSIEWRSNRLIVLAGSRLRIASSGAAVSR